ncbi:hypothetical protein [Kocuria salina]|uniref:hypothetical protein n=1 Tax=Kocuria salina TaxID=1929416 RepID=UPI001593C449|nr:hypothetical protein [Kocuria salina]
MAATPVQKAEKALETARTTVRQWQDKAAGARAEAAELDANSGALILADPAVAEEISIKVDACHRRARAFEGAAQAAREQVQEARTALLEAWAAQYDKDAATAKQAHDEHKVKINELLAQLKDLDGWEYKPADAPTEPGSSYTIGRSAHLHQVWRRALNRAAYCRFALAEGMHPAGASSLRQYGGDVAWSEDMGSVVGPTPEAALQYLAELDRERTGQSIPGSEPADGPDDEFDPVEDADLISAMGGNR